MHRRKRPSGGVLDDLFGQQQPNKQLDLSSSSDDDDDSSSDGGASRADSVATAKRILALCAEKERKVKQSNAREPSAVQVALEEAQKRMSVVQQQNHNNDSSDCDRLDLSLRASDSSDCDRLDLSLRASDQDYSEHPSYNDIVLVGSDGVEVGANRALLASKSRAFLKLLLGSFGRNAMTTGGAFENVHFNFRGTVLKAVVEFVLTDNTKVLDIHDVREEKLKRQSMMTPAQAQAAPPPIKRKSVFDFFNRNRNNHNDDSFPSTTKSVTSRSNSLHSSTHSLRSLTSTGSHNINNQPIVYTRPQIETLVSLTRAAVFFQLPALVLLTRETLAQYLQRSPASAFGVLEACRHEPQDPTKVPREIEGVALTAVRNFVGPLVADTVEHLSPSTLVELLKDEKLRMDDYQLFQIVRRWAKYKPPNPPKLENNEDCNRTETTVPTDSDDNDNNNTGPPITQLVYTPPQRLQIATDLFLPLLRLECIDPPLLATSVADSDMVTPEQLLQAFQQQATAAHLQAGIIFQKPRTTQARWKKSLSNRFISRYVDEFKEDVLGDYPPMQSDIHQWTLDVDESGDCTWLGISIHKYYVDYEEEEEEDDLDALMMEDESKNDDDDSTGNMLQDCNWVYSNHGEAFHRGKLVASNVPGFGSGSTLTFTLYLHWKDHGTLIASVDGGPEFVLFRNLRNSLSKGQGEGFLPTVSMLTPGSVSLVDIRHVRQSPLVLDKLDAAVERMT